MSRRSVADRFQFSEEATLLASIHFLPDAGHHFGEIETSSGKSTPLVARKRLQALQVARRHFDLPPFRIGREFAPQTSAAAKQQSAANEIFVLVLQIAVIYKLLELVSIRIEYGMIKLASQEFSNDLRFRDAPAGDGKAPTIGRNLGRAPRTWE